MCALPSRTLPLSNAPDVLVSPQMPFTPTLRFSGGGVRTTCTRPCLLDLEWNTSPTFPREPYMVLAGVSGGRPITVFLNLSVSP